MSDQPFDRAAILADIPAAISDGLLTISNCHKMGMTREQFVIASAKSPMAVFDPTVGFNVDAILEDIPGAIDAGVLTQDNAHIIGLSRGGFVLIVADIQAAAAGGGGGGGGGNVSDPNVAYVMSDGSDTHGEIGNPHKPYLTLQAAYDDGARTFDVGVGTFGSLRIIGQNVSIKGKGRTKTIFGSFLVYGTTTIEDAGAHSFYLPFIGMVTDEAPGNTTLIVRGVYGSSIDLSASISVNGGDINFYGNCFFENTISVAGKSASGGDGPTNGGNITVFGSLVCQNSIDLMGGSGDEFYIGGTGGTITLRLSNVVAVYVNGGSDGGLGRGSDGSIILYNSHVGYTNAMGVILSAYNSSIDGYGETFGSVSNFSSYISGY